MIWYNATDGKSAREVIIYDSWDIDPSTALEFRDVTIGDEGKYVRFNDGSELFTVVIRVTPRLIYTECGIFRRADIVHSCWPKRYVMCLYDVDEHEVHPAVKPYSMKEKKMVERFIAGEGKMTYITPRLKMLTLERLKEHANAQGMDENEILSKVVDVARNERSIHWKWSMTLLMHANGMDPNNYIFSHMKEDDKQIQQRIMVLDKGRTLTENVTLPGMRSIEKMLSVSAGKVK
jgi:hypothetical protein